MGHIRTRYFDDSDPASYTQQQAIPQFTPDNIESNMIHFSYQSDEGSEMSQVGGDAYMGGLGEVDADVFGYELAGPKRARLDDDSKDGLSRVRRAAEAKERECRDRSRLQDESGGDSNIGPSIKNHITKRGATKLRTIVGREGNGPFDYKKMLEDTKITMSMMNFYQASSDFSKSCRKSSTRINDKRARRKKVPQPASEPMPEEEISMAETSVAPAKIRSNIKPAFDTLKKRSTFICNSASVDEIPKFNLNMQPLVESTARKDRAFRVLGDVFSMEDGKSGRTHLIASIVCADQGSDLVLISPQLVRILNLKKYTLTNKNGQAITMGTADDASHKITDVKAILDIQRTQIRLGDRKRGEKRMIIQGPTFEFTKYHCLLLQPSKVPFKGVLREKCGKVTSLSKQKMAYSGDDSTFSDVESMNSSDDSIRTGSAARRNIHTMSYVSASTDSDFSIEEWFHTSEIEIGTCEEDIFRDTKRLMYTYRDLNATEIRDIPATDLFVHRARLKPGTRLYSERRIVQQTDRQKFWLQKTIEEVLVSGMYERVPIRNGRFLDWPAGARAVKKSGNASGMRITFNYHNVFEVIPGTYMELMLEVHDYLSLPQHQFFLQMDIKHAYWSIPVHESDRHIYAFFISGIGQLQPTRMPQGCGTLGFNMQELM
ncbi:hypothetical protein K3495_g9230 [Podosphaera aphanis]|nr:hypothetical protein K3495_g9230 [Podosphaera aphanis]